MKKHICSLTILIFITLNLKSQETIYQSNLITRWQVNPCEIPHNEYPRPQLQRSQWTNLNGKWQYSITDTSSQKPKFDSDSILVPFPIESKLSGVGKKIKPNECLWYRKVFILNDISGVHLLNFGAIDYQSTIFINGHKAGIHSGGYTSFSIDISKYIKIGNNEIIIKVYDPTDEGANPHGKQVLNPENIYYTSSTGIWQTVWMEKVNKQYISNLKITPNIDKETVEISLELEGIIGITSPDLVISINNKNIEIKKHIAKVQAEKDIKSITISIPDMRLWTVEDPFLYGLTIKLTQNKKVLDKVESYFGMRKVDIQKDDKGMDRIFLNNKYTYNLGTLDQGFWPEGIYTAPNDTALSYDIRAIKSMGFNTIRKHIKIEPDRWYYYADKLGVLVWQDFVNPPHGLPIGSKTSFENEAKEAINQLYNHPSIITWVLFNEGWGAYDQARLTKWVKQYDPTRLVNGHSGEMLYTNDQLRNIPVNPWFNSDLVDIHSYPFPRNPPSLPGKAKVVGEFGGIGVAVNGHEWNDLQGWGYIQMTANELTRQYRDMIDSLKKLEILGTSASIYTQPFDVECEVNGLITYDREIIKIPLDTIRSINSILTKNTNKFNDSTFLIAKTIDPDDNDSRFNNLLSQYYTGEKDSALLRRLILIAIRQKNHELVTKLGNDFINNMKNPFSKSNLNFISFITQTPNDKGFDIFLNNQHKVDDILGQNTSRYKIKEILRKSVLPPHNAINRQTFNWDSLQNEIASKYGEIGEEAVLGRRMIQYSGLLGNAPDWNNFGKFYMLYFKKAFKHPDYDINNVSWLIFLHITQPDILDFATEVVKYSIDNWNPSPEIIDTYANLLHKRQQTPKAIEWETKAVTMLKGSIHEKEFAETLQKMKDNKPTWPQN